MLVHDVVNPELIKLARQTRGYSQSVLAKRINVAPSILSRFEAGIRAVDDSTLDTIANVLDYPKHFFLRYPRLGGPGTDVIFHRKRQSITNTKLQHVYALAEVRRLEIEKLLEWGQSESSIPSYPVDVFDDDPSKIARSVRAALDIPHGPIFNMTRTLEQAGCVVVCHNFDTDKIDGFSHPPKTLPPIFHIHCNLPPDRWRWTLAHELGHVVMNHDPLESPKLVEQQANDFAGELLAPGYELVPMLHNLSFQRLAGLKREWKISMQALITRAYRLGTITRSQHSAMYARLGKAGYRTREPEVLDPPVEPPERLFQLAKTHMTQLEYSRAELMDFLAIGEKDFQTYYHDPKDVLPYIGDHLDDDEWRLQ